MDELPASLTRKYRPERRLAHGGFGSVWLATQLDLGRPVAVKVLHASAVSDEVQVARFRKEARITASLSHPNIVVLLDHGVDDGVPWIAYEYVAGESVRERLARGPIPWPEACRIADQVASALEAAHHQGILHRDIKPDNILRSEAGPHKVADFGIARWTGQGESLTEAGVILGTPAYISPLQIHGEAASAASDLYALGATLFEMVTGRPPFQASNVIEMFRQHSTEDAPAVSELVPGAPEKLDRLVWRLLAKTREGRFCSAEELRVALGPLLEQHAGTAASPPRSAPAPSKRGSGTLRVSLAQARGRQTSSSTDTVETSTATSSVRPSRMIAAVALIGLAGLVGAALWRSKTSQPGAVAPVVTILQPEFAGLRQAYVRTAAPLPAGVRLEVEAGPEATAPSTGPRVLHLAMVTNGAVHTFERLPPRAVCRLQARRGDGTLAGPPVEFTTPEPVAARAVEVLPLDDRVRLEICLAPPAPLRVELGEGDPPAWRTATMIPEGERLSIRTIPGLRPATSYWLRATPPGRWGGLGPYRFETLPASHARLLATARELVNQSPDDLEMIGSLPPDPRLEPLLLELLRNAPPERPQVVSAVARLAQKLRSRSLAAALVDRFATVDSTGPRIEVVIAACRANHPRAAELARRELDLVSTADDLQTLLAGVTRSGVSVPLPVLVSAISRLPDEASFLAAAAMLDSDPAGSADAFVRWLTPPAKNPTSLAAVAGDGLVMLPGPEGDSRLAELWREGRTGPYRSRLAWVAALRGAGQACGLVPPGTADATTLRALGFAGCRAARPGLESLAKTARDLRHRLLATESLGRVGAHELLAELMASDEPDVAEAAAHAVAVSRVASAVPALLSLARSGRDRRGVALWALARLGVAEGRTPVLDVLRRSSATSLDDKARLALAAWAAGELRIGEARTLLAALASRRGVPDLVRMTANDALAWMGSPRPPRTHLLLPFMTLLATGRKLVCGESVQVVAVALELKPSPPTHVDLRSVLEVRQDPVFAGVGLEFEPVRQRPTQIVATSDGELMVGRHVTAVSSIDAPTSGSIVRIVVRDDATEG
ncbi:MAG: serine/threonine protein kinase [Candidatus Riflebacteria bacterium]|nr:serine/threonine protein kinase [Candidatus Riflebacteria bacterium]